MDTLEGIQRFFAAYPLWARVLAGLGVAVTFFTLLLAPRSSGDRRANGQTDETWLIFKRVGLYGPFEGAQIRVTARVNGTTYIYPTLEGVDWLEVGPSMASQQFRLPRRPDNGYQIEMEMDVLYGGRTYKFQRVGSDFVTTVPSDQQFNLHMVENRTRGAAIYGVVFYRITHDPNT